MSAFGGPRNCRELTSGAVPCSSCVAMDETRNTLRKIIAVAVGLTRKAIKQAFATRTVARHDDARRHLAESAADAALQSFQVTPKPDRTVGPSLHSSSVPGKPELSG